MLDVQKAISTKNNTTTINTIFGTYEEIPIFPNTHTTTPFNNELTCNLLKINGAVNIQITTIYSQLSLDVNTSSGCGLKSNAIGHTKGHLTSGMLNNSHKGYVILIQDRIPLFI